MLNDKLVTKTTLNKNNKELYKKLKGYVDDTFAAGKVVISTDEEINNILSSKLVVKEDNDDLMFFGKPSGPK